MPRPDESDVVPPGPVEITDEINRFARGHFKEAQEVAAYPICLRLAAAHRVHDDHVPFPALGLVDRGYQLLVPGTCNIVPGGLAADGYARGLQAAQVLRPVCLQTRIWQSAGRIEGPAAGFMLMGG